MVIWDELGCCGLSRWIQAQKWLFLAIYWPMGYEGGSKVRQGDRGAEKGSVDPDRWAG